MVLRARKVLDDCKHALSLLEDVTEPDTFRVLWVSGIALARTVGHVLKKIDSVNDPEVNKAVAQVYDSWKKDRSGNIIFWEFIEQERNRVLKQYEMNFIEGAVDIVANDKVYTLDECLYCPIADGVFGGEDCRDMIEESIKWWDRQLNHIEQLIEQNNRQS